MVADNCPGCGQAREAGTICPDCGWSPDDDAELSAWIAARETDLEEQAFALADQLDERWPR